jgi:hypothetical protein
MQFARWWLKINAGKPLADILKEEVPRAKHSALRKGFERWRRAEEKKRRVALRELEERFAAMASVKQSDQS